MSFSKWVEHEIGKRGWSRKEAAKRADISPSMFDKVINEHVRPGLIFYRGIARAFKISLIEVLVQAGELDDVVSKDDETIFLFQQLFAQLDENDRDDIMVLIRAKIERKRKQDQRLVSADNRHKSH